MVKLRISSAEETMSKLARMFALLLLSLPIAALAEPVRVTTQSSGHMFPNPRFFALVGLDTPEDTSALPYDLTMNSIFDSSTGPYSAAVDVTLNIGTMSFQYSGDGLSSIGTGDFGFYHDVFFSQPGVLQATVSMRQTADVAGVDFPARPPLTPRDLNNLGPEAAHASVYMYATHNDPEFPFLEFPEMEATAESYSLHIVSAVPEPRSYGMLLSGMLTLGLLFATTAKPIFDQKSAYF
jgi:hypothetical protein